MLSRNEAISFLENILNFKEWEEILNQNRLEFLRRLQCHYFHHCYFQDIIMTATPLDARCYPDEQGIIQTAMKGLGGCCINQNGFIALLVQGLGFKSYLVTSTCLGAFSHLPDNHVICVVELNPGERYLLEVGVNTSLNNPVPLDKLPYEEVSAGYRFRYRKLEGSDVYVRTQLDGSLFGGPFRDKEKDFEYIRLNFTLDPKPITYFHESIGLFFTDIERSLFLQVPWLFRYYEEDSDGNMIDDVNCGKNRKYIQIRGVSVLKASDMEREVTHYKNYEELKPIIKKYFPKLPQDKVDKAWEIFNDHGAKHGYFSSK